MKVSIQLDLTEVHTKYVLLTYDITGLGNVNEFTLSFPTWAPGSYLVREYSSQVEDFSVINAKTKTDLKWQKISKSDWQIQLKKSDTIRVTYRVYANDLSVRGTYASSDMAFLNGTAVYFYPKNGLLFSPKLTIKSLSGWDISIAKKKRKGSYQFKNFDELFDTPILAAEKLEKHQFQVGKTKYHFDLWGDYDKEWKDIESDMKKILAKECQMFRGNPCVDYVFQILFVPGNYGGLEHCESSTNIFDGSILGKKKDYQRFLSLLAHEHFHLWNVKRIRPQALGPFDYSKEVYTRELWIAEGITSYYDDHFVFRAGVTTQTEYLEVVTDNLDRLENGKAAKVDTLSSSSFDAWIRFYRQNENSPNRVVSYYLKGGLIMMLMDFLIIQKTKGKHNLDDVMRELYQLYLKRPELGITREEFFEIAESISGLSFQSFIRDYIDGTKPVSWKSELQKMGLDLKKVASKNKFMGIIFVKKSGGVVVRTIIEDGPAYDSPLSPGDEIIAIDHKRITDPSHVDVHLKKDKVHVMYSRLGTVAETTLKLQNHGNTTFKLAPLKKLSATQKRNLNCFLRK